MPPIKKFYEYKNQTARSVDLYFYGDIVSSSADWWRFWEDEAQWPENVRNFLDGAAGRDINVYINSPGGNVFAGIAIYNMLKRHSGKVTVTVDALAASIASVIAFAGSSPPVVPKNAFLMLHKPWCVIAANADEFRAAADTLDRLEDAILAVYEENLAEGVTVGDIKALLAAETWMSGTEAAGYFNIAVAEENGIAAHIDGQHMGQYSNMPESIAAAISGKAADVSGTDTEIKRQIVGIAIEKMAD